MDSAQGLGPLGVGGDAVDAPGGELPAGGGQVGDRLEQVAGHQRDVDVELEVRPTGPPTVMAVSLPMTWADTWVRTSAMTGLTLPGMIEEPLQELGQEQLGQPGPRARPHPADVVGDLGAAHRHRLEGPGQLDQGVAGALGLERVGGRRQLQAGGGGDPLAHPGRELGVGVEAGADRGAAERQLAHPDQGRLDPLAAPSRIWVA